MTDDKKTSKEDFNLIVRIFSTDISGKKRSNIGLCKIRGVDKVFSNAVLNAANISNNKLIGHLTDDEVKRIEAVIKSPSSHGIPSYLYNRRLDPETAQDLHIVGSDLKLQNDFDIRRMRRIRSYKGVRHGWRLKVRGQRLKHYRKGGAAVARKKKVVKK